MASNILFTDDSKLYHPSRVLTSEQGAPGFSLLALSLLAYEMSSAQGSIVGSFLFSIYTPSP